MSVGAMSLSADHPRLPRRVDHVCVSGYEALMRMQWIDGKEAAVLARPDDLDAGVYAAVIPGGTTVYFEAHRDGSKNLMTVLWLNDDRGIAVACARSRAVLDRMGATT